MKFTAENYDPSKVDFSRLPENLKDTSDFFSQTTNGFKSMGILKEAGIEDVYELFLERMNTAVKMLDKVDAPKVKASTLEPEAKTIPVVKTPKPDKKKAVAKSVKVVPKVSKVVPKPAKPAKNADKAEKVKRVAKAAKEGVLKKNRAQYLKESEEILKREVGDKEKISAIKVINTARQINVLRSMRALMRDMPAVHKKRLAPTKENLEMWARNPGRYDMIGVDAPGGIGTITVKKAEQELADVVRQEMGLAYDYIEQVEKTMEAMGMQVKTVKVEAKTTKKRLKK